MVNLNLTEDEAEIIRRIVATLGPAELKTYLVHRQGAGYRPASLRGIEACEGLHRKGWLTPEPQMFDCPTLYLTPDAWSIYALDEWDEVEERQIKEQIADTFGEW